MASVPDTKIYYAKRSVPLPIDLEPLPPAPIKSKTVPPKEINCARRPKFSVMITEAIKKLKSRNGSSRAAILKCIKDMYDLRDEKKTSHTLKLALKKGLANQSLTMARNDGKNSRKYKIASTNEKVKMPTESATVKPEGSNKKIEYSVGKNDNTQSIGSTSVNSTV